MKFLLYTDPHWCQYSSIVRGNGEKYSVRLENLIQSINWAEQLAEEQKCWGVICLGDFFDKSELNASEISALKEIQWAGMSHYFLCGNHEMGLHDHSTSSTYLFDLLDTASVINKVTYWTSQGTQYVFLPYILEKDRKDLKEYLVEADKEQYDRRIIFSHNDIRDIQYGGFVSKVGFSIEEIECNCDLFLNGHLHNGENITNKVINLGNLTGQNFSENAYKYSHKVFVLDTETLVIEEFENPYAFNFYKDDFTSKKPSGKNLFGLKNNSIVSIKVKQSDLSMYKEMINDCKNIIESRLMIDPEVVVNKENIKEFVSVDHLTQFTCYIKNVIGDTSVVNEELNEVTK